MPSFGCSHILAKSLATNNVSLRCSASFRWVVPAVIFPERRLEATESIRMRSMLGPIVVNWRQVRCHLVVTLSCFFLYLRQLYDQHL